MGEDSEEDHSKAKACQASNPYVGISAGSFNGSAIHVMLGHCQLNADICQFRRGG
jgi:hypothetical protein